MASKFGGIPVNQAASKFGGIPVDFAQATATIERAPDAPQTAQEFRTAEAKSLPLSEAILVQAGGALKSAGRGLADLVSPLAMMSGGFGIGGTGNQQAADQIVKDRARRQAEERQQTEQLSELTEERPVASFVGKALPATVAGLPIRTLAGAAAFGGAEGALEPAATPEERLSNIGIGAGLGLAGGVVTDKIINPIASRVRSIGELEDIVEPELGIRLLPAQRGDNLELIQKQATIQRQPAATRKASAALTRQNKEAGDAVEDALILVAPDASMITDPRIGFRDTAELAVERTRQIRAEKTSPLYDEAKRLNPMQPPAPPTPKEVPESGVERTIFSQAAPKAAEPEVAIDPNLFNATTVTKFADSLINNHAEGSPARSVLQGAKKLIKKSKTFTNLHNSKLAIDDMINTRGDGALSSTSKRELVELKGALLDEMERVSPEYRKARLTFADESAPVDAIQNSLIGVSSGIGDQKLKQVSSTLFDSANSVHQISLAKKAISDVNPDAWNAMVRHELQRRLGKVTTDTGREEVEGLAENLPAKLRRSIFGNDAQRRQLFAALPSDVKPVFKILDKQLRRASLGRSLGSETAERSDFLNKLKTSLLGPITRFLRSPVTGVTEIGQEANFDRKVAEMADFLFDPDSRKPLIRAVRFPSAAAGALLNESLDTFSSRREAEERRRQPQAGSAAQ